MKQFFFDERTRKALKIMAMPFQYKVCAGCDSIVAERVNSCPNCHGYRFYEDGDSVISQARVLASRPQQSVTAEDLHK